MRLCSSILLSAALLCAPQPARAQFTQQGNKLLGDGIVNLMAAQGWSVALSGDGNTAIVGGPGNGPGSAWIYRRIGGVWSQQGTKLVGTGYVAGSAGAPQQGYSVALSADGNTAIVGGNYDNSYIGAAWVFTRSGGVWSQQGSKLVGTGAVGPPVLQGWSVALSGDGNTAIVGGIDDDNNAGAAWIFTRSGGVWTQQGNKLVGTGSVAGVAGTQQGYSVALSADGNTAIVGGPYDNGSQETGAAWVYTRSGGVWTQQGDKLVGTGGQGGTVQGYSVALSADGNTAIVGGIGDQHTGGGDLGAAWVFTRSGGVWSQQGSKLVGTGFDLANGFVLQGYSVALSGDGNTAVIGGPYDASQVGATWAFTRSGGAWTQLGSKLVGTGANGNAWQGYSVALSGDGKTAMVGAPYDNTSAQDNRQLGATWVFAQPAAPNSTTTDIGSSLNPSAVGQSVTFTATVQGNGGTPTGSVTFKDGATTLGSGSLSSGTATYSTSALAAGDHSINAVYAGDGTFTASTSAALTQTVQAPTNTLIVSPSGDIVGSGNSGGPFSPSSFDYQLSVSSGSVNYTVTGAPSWLDVTNGSGTATAAPVTVTFTVNSSANSLSGGTYGPTTITFTNTTNGQGNTTRTATLTVNFGGTGPPSNTSKHRRRRL